MREGGRGDRGRRMVGEWVAEGGGGRGRGSGLHSSNGMREPLSNRCRGGARSPRWLLRTLMSFSLALPLLPLPSPPRPASHPSTRRPPSPAPRRPPPPPSRYIPARSARATRRRCRHRRSPLFLLTSSPLFRGFSRRSPSFSRFPSFLSFSLAPREAAMTRVNLPQTPDRYRRTSTSLSHDAPPLLPSPYCRQLPPSLFLPLSPPPFTLYPSLATEHPATNLLRILYARLALDV